MSNTFGRCFVPKTGVLLQSAMILMQIGAIVNGGETNYIMATYSLYLSIFNIFISLLQILGLSGGDD